MIVFGLCLASFASVVLACRYQRWKPKLYSISEWGLWEGKAIREGGVHRHEGD